MNCEKCGNKPAVMTVNMMVNGEISCQHLCEDCASELMGWNSMLSFHFADPLSMIPGFFKTVPGEYRTELICEQCGMTYREFLKQGKFGCSHCYEAFGPKLTPIMEKLHFHGKHKGKTPLEPTHFEEKAVDPAVQLESEMNAAAAVRNYEKAAELKKQLEALLAERGEKDE